MNIFFEINTNHEIQFIPQSEIRYIIKSCFTRLNKLLVKVHNGFKNNAIHDFKVDVKKLRAFLRMLALELKDSDDLKLPHQFKNIYSLAGKIRDIKLQMNKLKDFYAAETKPAGYLLHLQSEKKKNTTLLKNILEKKLLKKIENKILAKLPEQLETGNIKDFIQQKSSGIIVVLSAKVFTDADLHQIRKNVKDIIYIFRQFENNSRIPIPIELQRKGNLIKAEKLANELGIFNDMCISLSFLKPAWINEIKPEERKQLQLIYNQWNQEKESLKQKLAHKLELVFKT